MGMPDQDDRYPAKAKTNFSTTCAAAQVALKVGPEGGGKGLMGRMGPMSLILAPRASRAPTWNARQGRALPAPKVPTCHLLLVT
jgi:hypothetical protein